MYLNHVKLRLVPWLIFAAMVASLSMAAWSARADSGEKLALALTADDARLQWGPCPEFLPQGCQIAVLSGDPAKPGADIFFKVPGKSRLPLHRHTSAEHMVLIAGELHVTYAGQATAILKPGTYAYGPAGQPHSGTCASATPCVLFIAFELPIDAEPLERTARATLVSQVDSIVK
jgi:quercetin dioxygenase-like cupin family protein